jgi:hypothetical protein
MICDNTGSLLTQSAWKQVDKENLWTQGEGTLQELEEFAYVMGRLLSYTLGRI